MIDEIWSGRRDSNPRPQPWQGYDPAPLEWLPFREAPEIPNEQIDHLGIDLRKPALLRPAFICSACSSAMSFLALPTSQPGRPIGIDAQNFLSFG